MNQDSFKHIETLFHELCELDSTEREARLIMLAESDQPKAQTLRMMFESVTRHPEFLDPSVIDLLAPSSVDIPLDGSVVLGDRYSLVERIGVGGSSSVFRARASDPSRDVAIKMLRIGIDSQQIRERFTLESHALASLTHPHIAHVYQTGIYACNGAQVPWIAMELIPGSQTITDYAGAKNLDENARVDLFIHVCKAVHAAHQSGVLHLDLNASNILIDTHGYPKIIDFGLFGILNTLNRKTPIHVGTRISMAPEQTVYQSGSFDERTDVYALGLLLTELLSGTQLQSFQGTSTEHALRFIAIGKARELLQELTQIPDDLANIIDTAIRVNPDERYQSIDQLLLAIQSTHGSPKTPWQKRLYSSIPFLGMVAALVIVAVLFVQLQSESSNQIQETQPESATPEMISIPRQLAIDLSSQNPRNTQYQSSQLDILERLGSVIDADPPQTPEEQADVYAILADQHRVAGQYDEAILYYQKSAQLLKEDNHPVEYNWVMLSLIQTHIFLERIDQAQHELELLDRSVDLSLLFRVDLSLAESAVHIAMNRREEALRQAEYTRTLINELKTDDERDRIDRLLDLAEIFEVTAEYRSAASTLRSAQGVAEQMEYHPSAQVAIIELKIGINDAPDAKGDALDRAIDQIEGAVLRLLEAGDNFHAAWGLRQLGNVHLRSGHFHQAIVSYAKARSQMIQLLGDDHHESIICRAYELIAQHANGDDSGIIKDDFDTTINRLTHALGENHSLIRSLRSDWDNLYLWTNITP